MAADRIRVDKWLFFTRVVKSRTLAAKMVGEGHVRVNRAKIDQPSFVVKVGDVLTVALDRKVLVLKVLAPGNRRGPATEAQALYEDLTVAAPAAEIEAAPAERETGAGRPTKRDRRALDRLRGDH